MSERPTSEFGRQIGDITERVSTLVREEVELAKAEMTTKVASIAKGAIFGIVAGVFAIFALIYLVHALALGLNDLFGVRTALWAGYLITGIIILIIGVIAGAFAARFVKRGLPPKPAMALQEAELIRGTLRGGSEPAGQELARQPVGDVTTGGRS